MMMGDAMMDAPAEMMMDAPAMDGDMMC